MRHRWWLAWMAVALLAAPSARAQPELSSREREIVAAVDAGTEEAIDLLRQVVEVNSGTMNHAGVREVGRIFAAELESLGFRTRWIAMPEDVGRAGHLFAERTGDGGGKRLLLIGHLDTVFEPNDPFQAFDRRGDSAVGPGVVDMKGGDVAIVLALAALDAVGALEGTTIRVALIGDEESAGLPLEASRGDLVEAAVESDVALGFEGGEPGRAVVARRGSSGWTLRVEGRQGHSSRIFAEGYGSGAVFEVARILHRFHEEVRGPEYLTFNPGIVLGGTEVAYDEAQNRGTAFGKTNVIARHVVVDGGLRFLTEEQKDEARRRMRAIVVEGNLPGTSAEIEFVDKYPAMPPTEGNRRLLAALDEVARALGQEPVAPFDPGARGAADISFVAPFVDGMDGLGVWGSGSHTPEETVDLASLPLIARRAAILMYRLTRPVAGETGEAGPGGRP